MFRAKENKSSPKVKLTRAEKKQLELVMAQARKTKHPQTAQQTIPYLRMFPDGLRGHVSGSLILLPGITAAKGIFSGKKVSFSP